MTTNAATATPYFSARVVDQQYIPVIDVTRLISGDDRAIREVGQQIVDASQKIGFFYITGHGIDSAIIARAEAVTRTYFSLSQTVKERQAVNTSQRGWMKTGIARLEGSKTHDLKEIFFWGPEVWNERLTHQKKSDSLIADNVWPDADFPALRLELLPYYDAVKEVGHRLLQAIACGLNLHKSFFEKRYTCPMARGQLVYYPVSTVVDESAERFGAAAHTDFGMITVLLQDSNGGLQVQNKQGEWVAAQPIDGSLVCNIGDLLNRWSNETLSSNMHRVINRSGNERHSIVVFFDPDPDAIIDPNDMGFTGVAEKYPPVSVSDYIHGKNKRNFSHYQK